MLGTQELGRPQDHQRGRGVAELERADADEQAPQPAPEDGTDVQPDRAALPDLRGPHPVRGVGDGQRRPEAGDDREDDRAPHADERDEQQREERSDDRAEVVHHPLEAVGAAVGVAIDQVGEQGVPCRPADPRATHAPVRRIPTCNGVTANPIALERTAVAVYPPIATVRRRCGSSASAPPASLAAPAIPSATPSISSEGRGGSAEGRGQEAREERGGVPRPGVGEEARQPDGARRRREPPGPGLPARRLHGLEATKLWGHPYRCTMRSQVS